MRILKPQHRQISHTARFENPVLELWGTGAKIAKGVYEAFLPFGIPLANYQLSGPAANAADIVITTKLGDVGVYKFAFDRVETTFTNFTEEAFRNIPGLLDASTKWLRVAVPSFKVASHHFMYFNHSLLTEGSATDFLKALNTKSLKSAGQSIGNGAIFNQLRPDLGWQTQLIVDRSATFSEGLFMSLNILVKTDLIDFQKLALDAQKYLNEMLAELGLQLPNSKV